jgi:hypothetical protein
MDDMIIPPRPAKKEPMLVPPPRKRKYDQEQLDLLTVPMDWQEHWQGMPEFQQQDLKQVKSIQVHLKSFNDLKALSAALGQQITADTRSVWFPKENKQVLKDKAYMDADEKKKITPKYPIYIVSKGRADSRMTAKALDKLGVPFFIVVEPQEYDTYCAVIDSAKVLILDMSYKDRYDVFDDSIGKGNSCGPGAARNFVWDDSIRRGFAWHWVMDDNIQNFKRLHQNRKIRLQTGAFLRACEEFVERYENVGQAGLNYVFFGSDQKVGNAPAYYQNTRIYSCNLQRNDLPFRWRGRYNEDTDLSLNILKAGWCTVLFHAFLCTKMRTQTLGGGCTAEFYTKEGTKNKSLILQRMHPDVARCTWRYGRDHHCVDYSGFKQKLILKPGVTIPQGVNEFGMELRYK